MDLFNSSSGSVEYNITMPEITCTPKGNYPSSYESLGNYLADLANDEIGVEEGINNDRIKEYFKEAGINAGPETAWCAAFVNYIYKQTNANTPEGYGQVRVNDWKNMGKATTTPQVGDLVFFDGTDHMGIVVGISGNQVTVIHGNSFNPRRDENNLCSYGDIVKTDRYTKQNLTYRTLF